MMGTKHQYPKEVPFSLLQFSMWMQVSNTFKSMFFLSLNLAYTTYLFFSSLDIKCSLNFNLEPIKCDLILV